MRRNWQKKNGKEIKESTNKDSPADQVLKERLLEERHNCQIRSLSLYQKWRFLDGKQGLPNMRSTLYPFLKILRQMIILERLMDWHELDSVCEVIII